MKRLGKVLAQKTVGWIGVLAIWGQAAAADQRAAQAKIDLKRGQAVATQVCVACHGTDGNSVTSLYPKLAGQHASYLSKQLHDYKNKAQPGKPDTLRANPIMEAFAAQLSEQDIQNVAAYFASQLLKPGAAHNRATLALGQRIWRVGVADKGVPACAGCHGPTGAGLPVQYPRLSGQWQDYTIAQLTAFRQGERKNSEPMAVIAARLSDTEIKAVADYIAGLH